MATNLLEDGMNILPLGANGEFAIEPNEDGFVTEDMLPLELKTTRYDPSEHTVAEVQAFISANPESVMEVLSAERLGKGRTTLIAWLRDFEAPLPLAPDGEPSEVVQEQVAEAEALTGVAAPATVAEVERPSNADVKPSIETSPAEEINNTDEPAGSEAEFTTED